MSGSKYNTPPSTMAEVDAELKRLVDASRAAEAAPAVGMVAMEAPPKSTSASEYARTALATSMDLRW